jgi:hypothetical protein
MKSRTIIVDGQSITIELHEDGSAGVLWDGLWYVWADLVDEDWQGKSRLSFEEFSAIADTIDELAEEMDRETTP